MGCGGSPKPPDTRPAAEAQRYAADLQRKSSQEALALLREQHAQSRSDQMPWYEAGKEALTQVTQMAGSHLYKPWEAPTAEDMQLDPGYQFRLQQGEQTLKRNMNAQGQTGATMKRLLEHGQNLASQEYGNVFGRALTGYNLNRNREVERYGRLAGIAGVGRQTAQNMGNQGMMFANQAGQNIRYGAEAMGAGEVGAQNAMLQGQMAQYRHSLQSRGGLFGALGMVGGGIIGGMMGGPQGAMAGASMGSAAGQQMAYW